MQKRILITGAAGFIGFHLASKLKERGDFVIGLDNFNDYYTPQLKKDRSQILQNKGIKITQADITDPSAIPAILDQNQITHVVHLAAQAGVRYSLTNPHAYIAANITGFLNILEALRSRLDIPLTYASSSSVYGTNTKIPFSLDDPTDTQASLYGVTKKTNELMAETYNHLFGVRTTGLRFFTVYGPWGRPDMAYYSFTKAISEGLPIDIYNHGNMRRDFTYVDDIIAGTVAAIDLGANKELFNLGNHKSEPLSALIESIETAVGKKAIIRSLPMQAGDVESTYADISHSEKILGFSPKVSLTDGIPLFVKWYQSYSFAKIK